MAVLDIAFVPTADVVTKALPREGRFCNGGLADLMFFDKSGQLKTAGKHEPKEPRLLRRAVRRGRYLQPQSAVVVLVAGLFDALHTDRAELPDRSGHALPPNPGSGYSDLYPCRSSGSWQTPWSTRIVPG